MSESEDEAAFASADEGGEVNTEAKGNDDVRKSTGASAAAPVSAPTETTSRKGAAGKHQKRKKKKNVKGPDGNVKQHGTTDVKEGDKGSAQSGVGGEGKQKQASHKDMKDSGLAEDEKQEKDSGPAEDEKQEKDSGLPKGEEVDRDTVPSSMSRLMKKDNNSDCAEDSPENAMNSVKTGASSVTRDADADSSESAVNKSPVRGQTDSSEVAVNKSPVRGDADGSISGTQVASPNPQTIQRSVPKDEANSTEDSDRSPVLPQKEKESGGWGGWGNWGTSFMSAASASVTTFTSQVGEGFNTLVESVESSLGAPPAEEIARLEAEQKPEAELEAEPKQEEKDVAEGKQSSDDSSSSREAAGTGSGPMATETSEPLPANQKESGWFTNLGVTNLTSKIQNTGKSFVSGSLDAVEALATGSLDVLETIGKKTINVLSEHDPGFKKTKQVMFDGSNKQNLSSLLREARDQAAERAQQEEEHKEALKANFGSQFDEFQGLAHLEALEILSNQSEKKVQALLSSLPQEVIAALKPDLICIRETFELEDLDYENQQEHEFSKLVTDHLSELHLATTPDKLNKVQQKLRLWISNFYTVTDPDKGEDRKLIDPKEIFQTAIQALAELTAKSVEQFHKAGELVLLQQDSDTSCKQRARSLASLTQVLCAEISILSTKYSQCLNKAADDQEDCSSVTPLVTNIYLEASNSSTYIQDGFQLLLPVLQQAAIEKSGLLQS